MEAVVHAVHPNDACYQEVELRLRSSLSAHHSTGYKISFKATKTSSAYLIIVRWNGALGDFTYLNRYDGAQYGVTEGDTVKATILGQRDHRLPERDAGRHRDRQHVRHGQPGDGIRSETAAQGCTGTNGDYGFTHLTATAN